MVSKKIVQAFVIILIAYLISSLALLFANMITPIVFWVVILFAAVFAFFLLPRLNK